MKRLQKNIAYTLIMTMLVGQALNIYAASPQVLVENVDVPPAAPKIDMTVDYLGKDKKGPGEAATPDEIEKLKLVKNEIIWIGVSLNNINSLGTNMKEFGVKTMAIAFDYDPTILVPCTSLTATDADPANETAWMNLLGTHNIGGTADMWDGSYQVNEGSTLAAVNTDSIGREEDITNGWKEAYVIIKKTNMKNNTNNRFRGDTEEINKKYLIKIPFKIVADDMEGASSSGLKLSRGPATLVLGGGDTGTNPYLQWNKDKDIETAKNLKNWVNFKGDINLKGRVSGPTNITVTGLTGTDDETQKDVARLYAAVDEQGNPMTETVYRPDTKKYFARLPANEGKAKIKITTTQKPIVTYNDYVTADTPIAPEKITEITGGYQVDISMADVNMLLGAEGSLGFNNTITITTGTEAVKIHIQKLVEPRIVLNYGNSVAGQIMKDTNVAEADKAAAINTFKTSKKYKNVPYFADEYDLDSNAYFIRAGLDYVDTGFVAKDSRGETVIPTNVERSIKVSTYTTFPNIDIGDPGVTENVEYKTSEGADYIWKDFAVRNKIIPGAYKMTYTFKDMDGQTSIVKERTVYVVYQRGDIDIDGVFGVTDLALINDYLKKTPTIVAPGFRRNADTDVDGVFGVTDLANINDLLKNSGALVQPY